MKQGTAIILAGLMACLTMVASGSLADDKAPPGQATAVEALVDSYITACDNKKPLLNSRSEELRQDAALYTLKGAYCSMFRDELVENLLSDGIEPKAYKVNHYLNERFFEVVRGKHLLVNNK